MKMTPLHLRILLHWHVSRADYPEPSPAASQYAAELETHGLIEKRGAGDFTYWVTTEKGDAHVEQLLKLPFPSQAWIGFDGQPLATKPRQ